MPSLVPSSNSSSLPRFLCKRSRFRRRLFSHVSSGKKKRLSFQLWLSDLKAPPGFWQEGLASGVMLAAPAVPSAQRPLHRLPGPRVEPPRGADLGWDWPPFCLPGGLCTVLKPLQCVLCHKRQGGGGNAGAQRMCSPLKESGCWKLLHPCRVQG